MSMSVITCYLSCVQKNDEKVTIITSFKQYLLYICLSVNSISSTIENQDINSTCLISFFTTLFSTTKNVV